MYDMERRQYLCQLASGPLTLPNTWPIYVVKGYKFHTKAWNKDQKLIIVEFVPKAPRKVALKMISMEFWKK